MPRQRKGVPKAIASNFDDQIINACYVRTHTRGIDKNTENKLKKRKLDGFFAAY